MNYLENPVCNFIPLFNIDYKIKKNILSVCLFKLTKGYKNFGIYVNGLFKLNKYVARKMPDFRIRLFIDNNIYNDKDIMKKLNTLNKVDMVLYTCSDFMVDSEFHDGLFGTLVRFFPMFDFPNNDSNIVVLMDADFNNPESYLNIFKTFKIFRRGSKDINDVYLFLFGRLFHEAIKESVTQFTKPYAVASKIFNIKKINNDVLLYYLYEVKNNPNNTHFSDYEQGSKLSKETNFIFGVDEYFINNTLIDYFDKNKMCFASRYYYQIHSPIFFFYERNFIKNPNKTKQENLIKIIDFIMEKVPELKNLSFEEKYDFIVNKLYFDFKENISPKINHLFYFVNYRIYLTFAILRKKGYFDIISKNFSDLLFEKNMGYIMIEKIQFTHCEDSDIVYRDIKLPEKYISRIKKVLDNKVDISGFFTDYQPLEFV